MAIYVYIPSIKKKIGVPLHSNRDLLLSEFIEQIKSRAGLPRDTKYIIQHNNADLFEKDKLATLRINDNDVLILNESNSSNSNNNNNSNNTQLNTSTTNSNTYSDDDTDEEKEEDDSDISNNNTNNTNNNNNNYQVNNNYVEIESVKSFVPTLCSQIDVIVIDCSGSMTEKAFPFGMSRIEYAQALFQTFIDKYIQYECPVAVGLVTFGDTFKMTFNITKNFDSFSSALGTISADMGGTRLYEAIQYAAQEIVAFKRNPDIELAPANELNCRIFCLTDGQDTSGIHPYTIYSYLAQNKIIIDSIPIGTGGEKLPNLSKATGGTSFFANNVQAGINLFEREALVTVSIRENFKPFPIFITNLQAFDYVQGHCVDSIQRAANPIYNSNFSSKVDLSKVPSHKLVLQEYNKFINSSPVGFTAFLNSSDNRYWKVIYKGAQDTPYENGHWVISLEFPSNFPNGAPKIRFLTQIYHFNISNDGTICLDILKNSWNPMISIEKVMIAINALLVDPNLNEPLDSLKASIYRDNITQYWSNVRQWTHTYARASFAELAASHHLN
ncbi:hypothetical protein CYY_004512 [Polysphondylium violaceum]|uniref:Ubiquitin-conjugating enzyme E2 n=1 Tax=Polysphondylium violaceum TaxID=133409 RepID=A0A8J4PV12_9MYCE|nr:hypothetical protein CYY_004512 [Polysphondylium violaceum]